MPDSSSTEYDLFISHSSGDRLVTVHGRHFRLIDELKRKLEDHYHPTEKAKGRARRFRVCTFEEDFQLTGDVATAIESQLNRSRAVLVICSEASTDSRYVRSEVAHFKTSCPDRPLIAGFWNVMPDEAFPDLFVDDTIGANLRPSIVTSFDDWLEQLDDECHKVVAQAWGLELKDVHDRFVEQGRKKRRRVIAAGAAVVVALAGIGGLALNLWHSSERVKDHNAAVIEIKKHGFQVESRGAAGGNTLIFSPPGGSEFADPSEDHATRGLAAAGDLLDVRSARLSGAAVTDRTIAGLAGLPRLRALWLKRANVTDASIGSIVALTELEELHLNRTLITDEGVSRLQEALPGCRIDRSREQFVDLSGWRFAQAVPAVESMTRREKRLSAEEWTRVFEYAEQHATRFGYPESREGSLLVGSFNIRRLGPLARIRDGVNVGFRSPESYLFLAKVLHAFDLIAVQEVMSDLEGVRHLHDLLGPAFELTYSPPSGNIRLRERVAYFHKRQTVKRTEVTGNILLDATSVSETLVEHWPDLEDAMAKYVKARSEYESGEKRIRPMLRLPKALGFLRTPFMASFELGGGDPENPYRILAVNAHLQFGFYSSDRRNAVELLIKLLVEESIARRAQEELGYEDLMLLGDLNLDYDKPQTDGPRISEMLSSLVEEFPPERKPTISFPFLAPHPSDPSGEVLRTNFRRNQTFDQIVFIAHDPRLAALDPSDAGRLEAGFDYGVFDWVCLFLGALPDDLAVPEGKRIDCDVEENATDEEIKRLKARLRSLGKDRQLEFDVSDHLPIWVRLPAPE